MQIIYDAWPKIQKRHIRLETPRDMDHAVIAADECCHRWSLIENLRGRFLDADYRRSDLTWTRNRIRDALTPLQIEMREELRAACGDEEAIAAIEARAKLALLEEKGEGEGEGGGAKQEQGELVVKDEEQEEQEQEEEETTAVKSKGKRGAKGSKGSGKATKKTKKK